MAMIICQTKFVIPILRFMAPNKLAKLLGKPWIPPVHVIQHYSSKRHHSESFFFINVDDIIIDG